MSEKLTGGCLCGAVRYSLPAQAGFELTCYCRDCQHISGGGHLPQLMVDRSGVEFSGPLKTHIWKADSGNDLELGFCAECGSPLYKATTMAADKIALVAGSLDDPAAFGGGRKVFESGRLPWDKS